MAEHSAPGQSHQPRDYTPQHDKEHGLINITDLIDSVTIDRAIRLGAIRVTPREIQR